MTARVVGKRGSNSWAGAAGRERTCIAHPAPVLAWCTSDSPTSKVEVGVWVGGEVVRDEPARTRANSSTRERCCLMSSRMAVSCSSSTRRSAAEVARRSLSCTDEGLGRAAGVDACFLMVISARAIKSLDPSSNDRARAAGGRHGFRHDPGTAEASALSFLAIVDEVSAVVRLNLLGVHGL
mmetsp:Transcript_39764/g.132574  ORF Transcript_39764/g.132574 Transcript_39764/m.132574 type:complete len:181 (-) Transcript_39764:187-729(-)